MYFICICQLKSYCLHENYRAIYLGPIFLFTIPPHPTIRLSFFVISLLLQNLSLVPLWLTAGPTSAIPLSVSNHRVHVHIARRSTHYRSVAYTPPLPPTRATYKPCP